MRLLFLFQVFDMCAHRPSGFPPVGPCTPDSSDSHPHPQHHTIKTKSTSNQPTDEPTGAISSALDLDAKCEQIIAQLPAPSSLAGTCRVCVCGVFPAGWVGFDLI